ELVDQLGALSLQAQPIRSGYGLFGDGPNFEDLLKKLVNLSLPIKKLKVVEFSKWATFEDFLKTHSLKDLEFVEDLRCYDLTSMETLVKIWQHAPNLRELYIHHNVPFSYPPFSRDLLAEVTFESLEKVNFCKTELSAAFLEELLMK